MKKALHLASPFIVDRRHLSFVFCLYLYIYFFSFSVVLISLPCSLNGDSNFIESADSPGLAAAYVLRQDTCSLKFVFPAVFVLSFYFSPRRGFHFSERYKLLTGVKVHHSPLRFCWHLALDLVRSPMHFQVLFRTSLLSISFGFSRESLWLNFGFRE